MPRCSRCGNTKTFASTLIPPAAATANAPPYGILANFDEHGSITTVECQGGDLADAQASFEKPSGFFNVCPVCGSNDVEWH